MKKLALSVVLGATLAVGAGVMMLAPTAQAQKAKAQTEEFAPITHAQLVTAIKGHNVTLLDANGTDSWKSGHIPGALNYEAVSGDLKDKLPKNKKALIVAYCGNEYCTAYKNAAAAAEKLGYTNVKHYTPGIKGWKESGAKVEKS